MREFTIPSRLFDRKRKLILSENYLEYEDKDLIGHQFTRIEKLEILDFKHGMDWIVWYKFTVGRRYNVSIKFGHGREIKISFNSYFGLSSETNTLYSEIVNSIWKYYHTDVVDQYIGRLYNDEELKIQGIKLSQRGIRFNGLQDILAWDKVAVKDYQNYFAVYDKDHPELNSRVSLNEYGAETLWSTIQTILKEKEKFPA